MSKIDENKALCERYPFLVPRNRWTDKKDEDYDYSFTEMDAMPEGWRTAFGDEMLEEIREDLVKNNYLDDFRIMQIKEKFGELRFYTGAIPLDSKVFEIINKYTEMSRTICIHCGKRNIKMVSIGGWISPYCKECYEEIAKQWSWGVTTYEEAILEDEEED